MELEKSNKTQVLTGRGKINHDRLSPNQYMLSLLNEGIRTGLLNKGEVYVIQNQLILILKNLIWRYTQGKSSSVTSATAENIMSSILYAIDAYLLKFDNPEEAMTVLKTVNISRIYEQGVNLLRQYLEETKQLYQEIKRHKLDVEVEAYQLTIDAAIPAFLRRYGILFDAHHTLTSMDYPLAFDDMSMQGILYVKQYLERLKMETHFCCCFKMKDLQKTLVNFGRTHGIDYRIELFNIFELTLNNAVFSVVSGGEANQLRISTQQYERLNRLFTHLDDRHIHSVIFKAIDQVRYELNLSDPQLSEYMNRCGHELIQRVIEARHHNNLQTVVIREIEEKHKPLVTAFTAADRMSDRRFRLLTERIMACQKTEDKIGIIKSNFCSLPDYLDLFNANCLYDHEFTALLKTFGDIELAILAKSVFNEELRNDSMNFISMIVNGKEPEEEWQAHYIAFLQNMSTPRITNISKLIQEIDYEVMTFD